MASKDGLHSEERQRERIRLARDVGASMPPVVDKAARERCGKSLKEFLETYHTAKFTLAWSDDHLTVIERLETCILNGGQFALAMPRGSGKTTIAMGAVEWALLYGYRRYVAFVGATESHAWDMIASIKTDLETNEGLYEDFPEVCHPIRMLEGIGRRAAGQTYLGERTCIVMSKNLVTLPTIKASPSSGAMVRSAGITGKIRGFVFTNREGENIRPDFCIADDPQTAETARSFMQNNVRENIIKRDIMGLAGPGKKMSLVIPCTVIEHDDLAARLLDNGRNPEFQGETFKLLYSYPTNTEHWDRYAIIRAEDYRAKLKQPWKRCNEYYVANRNEMDAGAKPGWRERYFADEISAIQHCMNLFIADPKGFKAEFCNEPERHTGGIDGELEVEQVISKLTNLERATLPVGTTRLTASIDVGGQILYYTVTAWDEDFNATTIEYGTYPPQGRPYFTAETANPKLSNEFVGSEAARVFYGLTKTCDVVLSRRYGDMKVERCLIDSGKWADVVYKFCNQSPYYSIITPSKGYGIAASAKPMTEWPEKDQEKKGWNWRARRKTENQRGVLILFDSNSWKTKFREMIIAPFGAPGSWGLFGDDKTNHELFIDHLRAEFPIETTGQGRTLLEWKLRLDKPNNHWLDCVIMSLVAGSYTGLSVIDVATQSVKPVVAKRNTEPGEQPKAERREKTSRRRMSYQEIMAERARQR